MSAQQVTAIPDVWERLKTFTDATHLVEGAGSQVASLLSDVPISVLFGCLEVGSQSKRDDLVQLVCVVLQKVFLCENICISPEDPELSPFIAIGLSHREITVRKLTATFLSRVVPGEWIVLFIPAVVQSLFDESTVVAEKSHSTLLKFIIHGEPSACTKVMAEIKRVSDVGMTSVIQIRILALISDVCALSTDAFQCCKVVGVLALFIKLLDSGDVLALMSTIQFVSGLCRTVQGKLLVNWDVCIHGLNSGVDYMVSSDMLHSLLSYCETGGDSFLLPSALPVVGAACFRACIAPCSSADPESQNSLRLQLITRTIPRYISVRLC